MPAARTPGPDRAPPLGDDAAHEAPAPRSSDWLEIGEVARRAGVAASTLRFYEAEGLLEGSRAPSGRRRYPRSVLRRIAFIRVSQSLGVGLAEIREALASLPGARTPTVADWERLSRAWGPRLDERIAALVTLRERLASCIGCGCLSIRKCRLYNPADLASDRGAGPRWLMGDTPPDPGAATPVPAPAPRPRSGRVRGVAGDRTRR